MTTRSLVFTALLLSICIGGLALTGCAENRTGKETSNSTWLSFSHIRHDFEAIRPHETKVDDLDKFGFGKNSPNVKLIDYLRLREYLLGQNKDATEDLLSPEVRTCLSLKDACKGLIVKVRDTNKVGLESFSNRLLKGQKTTEITGWEYEGIIIIQNDLVVYAKPRTEDPNIRTMTEEKDPRSFWEKVVNPLIRLPGIF